MVATPATKINHAGISGGKDSTALMLWMVHESGYPKESLRFTFADTGNESPLTYEYVQMLSERVWPVETLKPDRDFYELALHKRLFPSARRRFCTQELKLEPSRRYAYALLDAGHEILLHTGVRAGESPARAMLEERGFDDFYCLPVFRPLLRWSLDGVWAIHERYGVPRNPLYYLGMRRVGCFPCVMSSKGELLQIARRFPERVAFLEQKEREVNAALGNPETYRSFFHVGDIPLSQRTLACVDKEGHPLMVGTVADKFRWAATARGGQQYTFDFGEEPVTCSHLSGACE